jgi:uncharacterized protein YdeI (YjbR/CyaY-like superfamily)
VRKGVRMDYVVEEYKVKLAEVQQENLMLKAYIRQLETEKAEGGDNDGEGLSTTQ